MPWTNRPFDYFGTSPTQILDDLTKANDNFEILGQAFVGNDPTTQKAKDADKVDGYHASQTPSANTIPVANALGVIANAWLSNAIRGFENPINPVAYYNQTGQEYFLQVGEVAKVSFFNTTIVPLRIATQSDTAYMMWLLPSNTGGTSGGTPAPIYLNPNNTTYSNAFVYAEVYRNANGFGHGYATYSSFRIGYTFSFGFYVIRSLTTYKSIVGMYDVYGNSPDYPAIIVFSTDWRNTTTPWTSLGTVVFPQNSSGHILIQRIL
ncbi:MAG: hypothetical protein QW607_12150 [Desulfurococcaceae archaeon]